MTAHTDWYRGHFARLVPDEQAVEVVAFETADPAMPGEMRSHGRRRHGPSVSAPAWSRGP